MLLRNARKQPRKQMNSPHDTDYKVLPLSRQSDSNISHVGLLFCRHSQVLTRNFAFKSKCVP